MSERKFTHVDCFAGPGGICTGLAASGFDTKVAIEYIRSCCDTYSYNHPDVHVICNDIRKVEPEDVLPFIPKDGVDLVTSGMPCETFSTAGNSSRSFYDERQVLFREGIRMAKICNAKLLLFENVVGITSKKMDKASDTLVISVLKKELTEAGYGNYVEIILDAALFGVPQHRKRFFILAARDNSWILSVPKESNGKITTVRDAFCDLPNVIPNSNKEQTEYEGSDSDYSKLMKDDDFWCRKDIGHDGRIVNHLPMKHRECTLKRFSLINQGESLKTLFDRYDGKERKALQEKRILPKKMFIKRNYRLVPEEPSPTVTSHCLDEFIHPEFDRALTVRECARLQSFPDSYNFVGGPYIVPHINRDVQDKYEQIGDAVPPLLAYAWGKTIKSILKKYEDYE